MSQDVNFANMLSITVDYDNPATIHTRPVRVQGVNHGRFELVIHHIFASAGGPSLTWTAEGSNDGEHWHDQSGLTGTESSEDTSEVLGDVLAAYIRVRFNFSAGAQSGDYGSVCLDFNVHLVQK